MTKSMSELNQHEIFQKISGICSVVTQVLTDKALLEISLEMTMELFRAKRGSVFILSDDGKELIMKIARGMPVDEQEKMVKRLGEGVVGKVAEMKKPVVVDDITQDNRFKHYKARRSYQTPSFICAPLLIKDHLIGVINIADKDSGGPFINDELQLLDFLATQIALNYRRIHLYEQFKDILKESQSLKDELGKSSEVTNRLMKQVIVQDRLASIGKLAGGIAHELNNPLDGILRYVNLTLDHVRDDDVVRGYLLEVKHGLNRMVNIIRNLLACSRNDPPTRKKIKIHSAIEEAISGIRSEIFHKDVRIIKNYTGDLPEITDLGIERVVSNLLRNALDAIGEHGQIKISTEQSEGKLILRISDNGCGISREHMERIFEPFFTTKDIEKGCGLGLTIVSEIIKSYNGDINIESAPGQGTTFNIRLPLEISDVEKAFRI